jgi:hypothetical protein
VAVHAEARRTSDFHKTGRTIGGRSRGGDANLQASRDGGEIPCSGEKAPCSAKKIPSSAQKFPCSSPQGILPQATEIQGHFAAYGDASAPIQREFPANREFFPVWRLGY